MIIAFAYSFGDQSERGIRFFIRGVSAVSLNSKQSTHIKSMKRIEVISKKIAVYVFWASLGFLTLVILGAMLLAGPATTLGMGMGQIKYNPWIIGASKSACVGLTNLLFAAFLSALMAALTSAFSYIFAYGILFLGKKLLLWLKIVKEKFTA